jgi:hypothetical protein
LRVDLKSLQKFFKLFSKASESCVIVEGFTDRGEVLKKEDGLDSLFSLVFVKNIQPISVGVW